jgi:hypothetical protein
LLIQSIGNKYRNIVFYRYYRSKFVFLIANRFISIKFSSAIFYGIIMDTIRDGILRSYGVIMWKRIVNEVKLPSETFVLVSLFECFQ